MGRKEVFRKRNAILKINKKQEKKNIIQDKHYEKRTLIYKRPLLQIEQTFEKLEKAKHVDKIKTLIQQKVSLNFEFMNEYHSCVFETEQKSHNFPQDIISCGELYSEYVSTDKNKNLWYVPEKTSLCFNLEKRLESVMKMEIDKTTSHLKESIKASYEKYLTLSTRDLIQEDLRTSQEKSVTNITSEQRESIEAACSLSSVPAVKRGALLDLIDANQIIVVGSSRDDVSAFTEVPVLLLSHRLKAGATAAPPRIVCSTPHFLTAQLAARALGAQLKDGRHSLVELDVGFKKKKCPESSPPIVFLTNHQLVYHILDHPALPTVTHVILDRAQHRDDMFDLVLTYFQQYVLPMRRDLRLILLSSPFSMDILAKHFHLPSLKLSQPPRRPTPVHYLENILQDTGFDPSSSQDYGNIKLVENNFFYKDYEQALEKHINLLRLKGCHRGDVLGHLQNPFLEGLHLGLLTRLLTQLARLGGGATLVLLPHDPSIGQLHAALTASAELPSDDCVILKYHSKIAKKDATHRKYLKEGKSVIILATDSIEVLDSIQGVRNIVDCGCYEKEDFLTHFNISTREIEWTTRQIADERKSWCENRSRTQFYRVYTSVRGSHLRGCGSSWLGRMRPDHLTYLVKRLHILDVNSFLEHLDIKPQHRSIHLSIKRFQALGILDSLQRLTPAGYSLSCLPMPPHLARMLVLGCVFSCLDPVLSIVAVLLHHDPFDDTRTEDISSLKRKLNGSGSLSDHLLWVRALLWFETQVPTEPKHSLATLCHSAGLLYESLALLLRVKGYLRTELERAGYTGSERCNVNGACENLVEAIVYAGLYPNVAVVRSPTNIRITKLMKVTIHPSSVYHSADLASAQPSTQSNSGESAHIRPTQSDRKFIAYSHCYGTDMGSCTEQVYLRDVTPVCTPAVLLFSHDLHTPTRRRGHRLSLRDKAYHFRCSDEDTAAFIEKLRLGMNEIIDNTIVNRTPVDWSSNSRDVHLLRCAVTMIENKSNAICKVRTLKREDMKALQHNGSKKDFQTLSKRKKKSQCG